MPTFPRRPLWPTLLTLSLVVLIVFPGRAAEKEGMPDLAQINQTCLPTSTSNLIVWFGTHGYPKLIVHEDSRDNGYIHTVHGVMTATDARFDVGTQMENVTSGIKKYIQEAGYGCDVQYRGLAARTPFTQDWLKENDDPRKGFILLLSYCQYDPETHIFTNAWNAGHAVTLVNAESNLILVHDPAHEKDTTGRKILTPQVVAGGTWQLEGFHLPVAGLLLLSGSQLEAPPESQVMLTGAVCVTMYPVTESPTPSSPTPVAGPNATIAGSGAPSSPPAAPAAPQSAGTGWMMWLFDLFFKK